MSLRIDTSRRFNRQHPFDIWRTLNRLRVMDKLQGLEERFFTREQIAAVLYSNWDDLSVVDQRRVVLVKLDYSVAFLRCNGFIKEESKTVVNSSPSDRIWKPTTQQKLDRFKACANIFQSISSIEPERAEHLYREAIDKEWAPWIGRRSWTPRNKGL